MDKKTKIIAVVAIIAVLVLVVVVTSKKQSAPSMPKGKEPAVSSKQKTTNLKLAAVGDSKISGTAEINAEGDKTNVVLNLEGQDKDTVLPAHIQSGTCENAGWIKYVLNFPGSGKPETILDVSYDEMMKNLPLSVVIKDSVKKDSKIISCGEIK